MPELPEVETICRELAPRVEGRVLSSLEILDERWCAPISADEFREAVEGRAVDRVVRRGKYIVWELEDELFLHMHLRMTGTIRVPSEDRRHVRVRFLLSGGEEELWFVDPRRFGTGELAVGYEAHERFFASRIGMEPFSAEFTSEALHQVLRASKAPVKAVLLNQRRLAGVGNIYADEALFRAKTHPLRPANALNRPQSGALHQAIITVLNAGIKARGASIDDYRDPGGSKGSFQNEFLVHRREGEPCPRCGSSIRKIRAAGRGTYVCESCQRQPRPLTPNPSGSEQ